ncbi:hypothetical protein [Streptomyces sp. EKS3.2]|uniref:hypothetical protein n=1 Tax=Streptomyces sp. EKS3.2 TaxID=3461008 RepID=UPI0040430CE5
MTTAVERITDEKALATLREVVAERPEYMYSAPNHMKEDERDASCFYVHTDEDGSLVSAGCAIGVVLHRLGVPLDALAKEEGCRALGVVRRFFPNLSQRTYERFNDMQMSQDDGNPWGLAYAQATGETI